MLVFSRARLGALGAAGVIAVAALLWLPYRFPVEPVVADSYIFGFNNHVGVLIFFAFCVAVAIIAYGAPIAPQVPRSEKPLTSRTLRRALLATLLLGGGYFLLLHTLGGYSESIYLIDRVKLLLESHHLYQDFEFPYGALLVYGPAWVSRWLHLPVADAYGLFWLATSLLGVWLTYSIVQQIDTPSAGKRFIFLFFASVGLLIILCTGLNYTLFRFMLPGYFGLAIYRRLAPIDRPASQPGTLFLLAPCGIALLCVSPELALAFVVGMGAYLAIFGQLRRPQNLAAFAAGLLVFGLGVRFAASRGAFYTLDAFRQGGYSFPIVPAIHILIFFFALALTLSYAVQQLRLRQGSALLVLIAVSAPGVAGALSRCDPIHVLMNPVGVHLAALAIARSHRGFGRVYRGTVLFVSVILPSVLLVPAEMANLGKAALPSFFRFEGSGAETRLDALILKRMTRALGPQLAREKFDNYKTFATRPLPVDFGPLYGYPPGTVFEVPFGFSPSRFGTTHRPQLDEGFFFEDLNLLTDEGVARKVGELARHPERPLLILPGRADSCTRTEGDRVVISALFLYPYRAPGRHVGRTLDPLCNFIHAHYAIQLPASPERYGYDLWQSR